VVRFVEPGYRVGTGDWKKKGAVEVGKEGAGEVRKKRSADIVKKDHSKREKDIAIGGKRERLKRRQHNGHAP